MKPYFSVLIFLLLSVSSIVSGIWNYAEAEDRIQTELNRALSKTIEEKSGEWITADTIRAYRHLQQMSSGQVAMLIDDENFSNNLSIPQLRDKAYISFTVLAQTEQFRYEEKSLARIFSDTIIVKPVSMRKTGVSVAFRCYADCSVATVFILSDKKLPLSMSFLTLLWAAFSVFYLRRRHGGSSSNPALAVSEQSAVNAVHACSSVITVGNLSFNSTSDLFFDSTGREIKFTPMQHALMEMFFKADTHRLSKADICDALWHGKDDASETLYTLMRRIKPVIERNSNLRIEVERGKAYRLVLKEE